MGIYGDHCSSQLGAKPVGLRSNDEQDVKTQVNICMVKSIDYILELLFFLKLYWLPWTVSVYYLCYHICIREVFHIILLLIFDELLTRYLYAYVIVCLGLKHLHIIGNINFACNCHEVLVSTNIFQNISICEHRYSKQTFGWRYTIRLLDYRT